jgi:hypothetical protein
VVTHRWKMHAIVDMAIEGVPVPMLLDTGAPITVVDRSAATRLHRPERRLQFPMPPTPDARISLATAVDAGITLGDISLGARAIPIHPQERIGPAGAHGVLGTDILFGYAFQADGDALRLTPRSPSLVDSVKARLSRWRDLPDSPDLPGCVRADITPIDGPTGRTVRVHLHVQRSWSRATRYLFGCAGAQPAGVQPLWIEIAVEHPADDLDFDVQPGPVVPIAAQRTWAETCQRLVLLDINPTVPSGGAPRSDHELRLVLQSRGLRLR